MEVATAPAPVAEVPEVSEGVSLAKTGASGVN